MQICHFLEHLLNQLRSCFLEIAVSWVQTNIQILHRFKHFLLWRLKMPSFLYQDLVCLFQWPSLTLQWSRSLPAVASSGQKNFSCSVLGARKEHQCLCLVSHEVGAIAQSHTACKWTQTCHVLSLGTWQQYSTFFCVFSCIRGTERLNTNSFPLLEIENSDVN